MSDEDFLRRWSRLKRESTTQSEVAEQAPQLPPLDSLNFESDFKAFMHSKVEESVKRAALKKLFADPRFNVMDGLDTYIADYTKSDTIPEEMLARMQRAKDKLFNAAAEKSSAAAEEAVRQIEAEEAMRQES